jgi:hypothetical protein
MTKSNHEDGVDWSLTTRKGSRLRQHREFLALPFRRKMELLEELCDRAGKLSNLSEMRKKISLLEGIARGEKAVQEGRTLSNTDARKRIKRWLA